ncbi:interaptin-like, partial [Engraulis encrasicolus]|uniref:interaptin-like n=1 Tax=Engraulis encrasicolus TaxID=184585 RepID=UPI002FD1FBA9
KSEKQRRTQEDIQRRDREAEENKKRLEQAQQDVKIKDSKIQTRDKLIQDRDKKIETTKTLLDAKDLQIKKVENDLKEKNTLLKARNEEMERLTQQLEEKRKEIEGLQEQLEKKTKKVEERVIHLDRMKGHGDGGGFHSDSEAIRATKQVFDYRSDSSSSRPQPRPYEQHPRPVRNAQSYDFLPPQMTGESPGPTLPVSPAVSELRLVLLGGSAAGKRAAGNTILGTEEFGRQASTHTSTDTQHSESRHGEMAGRRVTVVDTPDWFCSGLSEKDMRQDVGLCVRLSAPGPHAFLLVVPVEPSEGEERRMLEKMEDIFGEGCWRHTLILFTHAEGREERSVEELLQTGSQELQQLVEKCGNRYHLLNIGDRPDDTEITQLLEKIEEMVTGNGNTFYSSKTYQEAERKLREIERRIQSERKVGDKKPLEKVERIGEHDKTVQDSLKKMEGEIQQHEGEIRMLDKRTTEIERKMKEERDEQKRNELERELRRESRLREDIEKKLKRAREKRDRERRVTDMRHREEMKDMRELYEREARVEVEKSLMKIILHELQRNISITKEIQGFNRDVQGNIGMSKEKMEGQLRVQFEQKDREIKTLRQTLKEKEIEMAKMRQPKSKGDQKLEAHLSMAQQREKDREIERLQQTLEEKEREIARMKLKQGGDGGQAENERLRQIMVKINREMEKQKLEINNLTKTHSLLSHSQSLLKELCGDK